MTLFDATVKKMFAYSHTVHIFAHPVEARFVSSNIGIISSKLYFVDLYHAGDILIGSVTMYDESDTGSD